MRRQWFAQWFAGSLLICLTAGTYGTKKTKEVSSESVQ